MPPKAVYKPFMRPLIIVLYVVHVLLFDSCVQSDRKIDNIGSKVNFPSAWKGIDTHQPGVPPLFIINFQIPSEFPTSIFKEITDGPGWSLVLYFRMSKVR